MGSVGILVVLAAFLAAFFGIFTHQLDPGGFVSTRTRRNASSA